MQTKQQCDKVYISNELNAELLEMDSDLNNLKVERKRAEAALKLELQELKEELNKIIKKASYLKK